MSAPMTESLVLATLCFAAMMLHGCGGGSGGKTSLTTTTATTATTQTSITSTTSTTTCEAGLSLDFRVSKALVSRDYSTVRLSVIAEGAGPLCGVPDLSYGAPFAQRWTHKMLHSGLVKVSPNGTDVRIGQEVVHLTLPQQGSGVTGLLVADPCIGGGRPNGSEINCPMGDKFQIRKRLSTIVNQLIGSDEFHFWGIVGDNFYDRDGNASTWMFEAIDAKAKSKPIFAVPGNHDFWLSGGPVVQPPPLSNQLGYGFMQFYGQDTFAATDKEPFDFSPTDGVKIPGAENFMFGTQLGDVAFFGYSGAHNWEDTSKRAQDFCTYVGNTKSVNAAIIYGHWNGDNLGCMSGMAAPEVHKAMSSMAGCKDKLLLYFDGHEHCNKVTGGAPGPSAFGFMIGASGMGDQGCAEFGFAVVQSLPHAANGPNVRVDLFQVQRPEFDHFDDLMACFTSKGYAGCRQEHAISWRSVPGSYEMMSI